MNTYTVDFLENEVREMEATIDGLAQERTELEDAYGRLEDAVLDAIADLDALNAPRFADAPKTAIAVANGVIRRLKDALG